MSPRGFPARHIGNPKLRDARLRRGWTGDDVAIALHRLAAELGEPEPGVDSTHVSKWERGTRNPGRFYKPRLCLVFEATPQEIGLAPNPRLLHDIGVLGRKRVARERAGSIASEGIVDVVRPATGVVHAPGLELPEAAFPHMDRDRMAAAVRYLWPIDRALVDGLDRAGRRLSHRTDTESPSVVLPDLGAYLSGVQALLARSQPAELASRLMLLASTAAMHVGFLNDVSDRTQDAYNSFAVAEALARESGDGNQLALILINKSEYHSRRARGPDELRPAVILAEAADLAVGSDAQAGLRAWIAGERAAQEAELQHDLESGHHIERAYRMAAGAAAEVMNLFSDLDSGWLEHYRGISALRLGHADEAIQLYEAVLRDTDPRLLWERAQALHNLAAAWSLKGELPRACALLVEAVELAGTTGNRRGLLQTLHARQRYLAKYRADPNLRHLDEVLRAARRQG